MSCDRHVISWGHICRIIIYQHKSTSMVHWHQLHSATINRWASEREAPGQSGECLVSACTRLEDEIGFRTSARHHLEGNWEMAK